VPYSGDVISEDRFNCDEPSGARKDVTNVTVDGAKGIAFYGWDDRLHDTREYWFIHDGLLYEVTTFKSLDGWLSPIMQSCQLISTGAIAWGDPAHGGRIFLNVENEARRRIRCLSFIGRT
jgi:hypothetical protein